MADCDKCGNPSYAYIIASSTDGERLCMDCYSIRKEEIASVINKLPDVVDVDPPLGYHFVGTSWYSVEILGKSKADYLFKNWGTLA